MPFQNGPFPVKVCDSKLHIRLKEPKYNFNDGSRIDAVAVSCGKCYDCIRSKINQWAFRLKQENNDSQTAYFVTLTYHPAYVPYTKRGFKTLDKKDVSWFMKRLRKFHTRKNLTATYEDYKFSQYGLKFKREPIKMYAVGEYGSLRSRPHYHLIIFNATKADITEAWSKGAVDIDQCNINTIYYTLKYMEKKKSNDFPKSFDGIKEFSLSSKGIGHSYIEKNAIYHNRNYDNYYLTSEKGFKIPMPKYYSDRMFTPEDKERMLGYIQDKVEEKDRDFDQKVQKGGINPDVLRSKIIAAKYWKLTHKQNTRYVD